MELHRYAISFSLEGEQRTWTGILDAHGSRSEFTLLSQLNQKGVISGLRVRDLGRVVEDTPSLFALVRELRARG